MSAPVTDLHPPMRLFEWLPMLALASGRKLLTAPQSGVALFVALSTTGKTGEGATIDADRLATELDISVRQVWRHVEHLTDNGWLEQTQKPTRATKGRPGRKARYRLTDPRLVLSDETPAFACHDDTEPRHTNQPENRLTPLPEDVSHDHPADPVDNANRLTFPAESCDIAERDPGTVLPSDGYPTTTTTSVTTGAAAARDELSRVRTRTRTRTRATTTRHPESGTR